MENESEDLVLILDPEKFNEVMNASVDTNCGNVILEDEELLSRLPFAYSSDDILAFYEKTGLKLRHEIIDEVYHHVFNYEGSLPRMGDFDHLLEPTGQWAQDSTKAEQLDEDICIISHVDDVQRIIGLKAII